MNYCLGTVQFGLNYGIQGNGQPQEEQAFEMMSYAISKGIGILDTASAYGEAETVLGDFFRKYPEMTSMVSVVSKLKPDAFSEADSADWGNIAVEQAKESLERIGIDRFSAYLFHNAGYIFDEEAVKALYTVKEAGLADRIGVSVYSPEEAMKALGYEQIEAIQIPYNLLDHRLDQCGFFSKAKEKGVTVFARSSLLQGILMMDPYDLPDRVSFARDYLLEFRRICDSYDTDPLKAAIGYVGSKDGIDYVVFGVDNIDQLEDYISLQESSLPPGMADEIEKTFAHVEEKLVNPVLWK